MKLKNMDPRDTKQQVVGQSIICFKNQKIS